MFLQTRTMPGKLEEEFSKPVESIMRCEDFKSNFARRLSNRYTSRSPVSSLNQDTALKLRPLDNEVEATPKNIPEIIELGPQLSKNIVIEQNGEAVKPPDKSPLRNSDIRRTEEEKNVLNMELETLRWQLAQTEANRQMHIALLKQIVAFLNRVKEHIESKNNESGFKKETLSARVLPRSFNVADLPRSRSVVHVNKNAEFFLNTPKKISTRKISKSISNVNGFKDCNGIWSQSKLSLTPEIDTSQKISEEMSRLITLANTVLTTKIPDLAYSCNDKTHQANTTKQSVDKNAVEDFKQPNNDSITTLDEIDEVATQLLNIDAVSKCIYSFKENGSFIQEQIRSVNSFSLRGSSLNCGLENSFSDIKLTEKEDNPIVKDRSEIIIGTNKKLNNDKRNDFNSTNFIEDESGFSSMSSFQEIGIPIISVIPPSPCKEIGFMEDIADVEEDDGKWKTDTLELEKQSVKVFWV